MSLRGKFSEALHPRGPGGKFKSKGGLSGGGRAARKATAANERSKYKAGKVAAKSSKKAAQAKERANVKAGKAARKEFKATHRRVLTEHGKRVRKGALYGGIPGAVIAHKTSKNKGQGLTKTVKREKRANTAIGKVAQHQKRGYTRVANRNLAVKAVKATKNRRAKK